MMNGKSIESWMKQKVKRDGFLWTVLKVCKHIGTLDLKKLRLDFRRDILKNGIFIFEDELWMASNFPKGMLDKTIELFNPRSVLDIGSGTGKTIDYLISRGIDVVGVEGSGVAISNSNHPELIIHHNLEKELKLGREFDLIWSYELVEHIHPRFLDNLLRTFSNHSDRIVMTAARPGQGGNGHFNEQPKDYWVRNFGRFGYKFNKDRTEEIAAANDQFAQNILILER